MRFSSLGYAAAGLLFAGSAQAIPFHYLDAGFMEGLPTAAITAAGHTPVALTGLTAADLAGVQVLWILNGSNDAPSNALTNNASAIADFVFNGGVLSYHDRYVGNESDGTSLNSSLLPGAAGISFVRETFSNPAAIDILDASTTVTDGLDDDSLDGGNHSSHGYALLDTLPAGATALLSRDGATNEIVDFFYQFGQGFVYYSTIPLDYYLGFEDFDGLPGTGIGENYDVYATNEAAFQASLAGAGNGNGTVPEPGTLALLGIGMAGMAWRRRAAARRS